MLVDLSKKYWREEGEATGGSIYYASGDYFWTASILDDGDGEYDVRIEDGWYESHKRTGEAIRAGTIRSPDGKETPVRGSDIVRFVPRSYEEHLAEHKQPRGNIKEGLIRVS